MKTKPVWLRAKQVAEKFDVQPATVLNWHKGGLLPAVKVGKTIRFKTEDVEKLLQPTTSLAPA